MLSFVIFICNRLIKLLAVFIKGFCYIFHFFLPRVRFLIPKSAEPFVRPNRKGKIPATLWQTNYSNRVTLPIYLNYFFNRLLSPTYVYRFMDNEDCLEFITENCPKRIVEAYKKLRIGAAKADFWRLLVLQKEGGVYMDIDAHLVWPLPFMIKPDDEEMYVKSRPDHYTNYFLASKKDNPTFEKIIAIVLKNIEEGKLPSVYELTGPPTVNQAIGNRKVNYRYYRYTCLQGTFTNEYFQYLDKPKGKWTHAKKEELLSRN